MEASVARRAHRAGEWKRYIGTAAVILSFTAIVLFYLYVTPAMERAINDDLRAYRGGTEGGLLLAYTGVLVLLAAQFYTVVKRMGVPQFARRFGGPALWLNLHIALSIVGLAAVLVHAGFPFRFAYRNLTSFGYAGLATYLLILTTGSGVFGRYLYRHLPAMRRAFAVWRPIHVVETALLFLVSLIHVWIVL